MVNSNTTPHLIESDLISRIIIQIEDEIRPHSNEVLIISCSGRKRMFSLTNKTILAIPDFNDAFFRQAAHLDFTLSHTVTTIMKKLNTPTNILFHTKSYKSVTYRPTTKISRKGQKENKKNW